MNKRFILTKKREKVNYSLILFDRVFQRFYFEQKGETEMAFKSKQLRSYTPKEELCHVLVHSLGIALSIAALVILVCLSSIYGNVWSIVSCSIFGSSLILLYTSSTLYHLIPPSNLKKKLKKMDHISIYFLIAGTYTPFLLVLMRDPIGWTLFGIVWGLALLGTILKLFSSASGTKLWSIGLYLAMGWLILVASNQLISVISPRGLTFLILGGLFYTLGIFFYIWKSRAYTHAVWHLFVLAGSIMHFFAVLFSCVFV